MGDEIMTMLGQEDGFFEAVLAGDDSVLGVSWRLAKSLIVLRDECNAYAPHRSKSLDGTIGDAAHQLRCSRHNPHDGVVTALDITHDPAGGMDTYAVAREIVKHPPKDLSYIISNKQVARRSNNWIWTKYTGSNPHTGHMHVAVGLGTDCSPGPPYDDIDTWGVASLSPAPFTRVLWVSDAQREDPKKHPYMSDKDPGAKGEIAWTQRKFVDVKTYGVVKDDGVYGIITEKAVIIFQKIVKLDADGQVGKNTYLALEKS